MPAICPDCDRTTYTAVINTYSRCCHCLEFPAYKCQECEKFYCSKHCDIISIKTARIRDGLTDE